MEFYAIGHIIFPLSRQKSSPNKCLFVLYPAGLKRSCEELYAAGERRTGVWAVDLDGTGPLGTSYVYCRMGEEWDAGGEKHGVTEIPHNLRANTRVRAKLMHDHKKVIKYR